MIQVFLYKISDNNWYAFNWLTLTHHRYRSTLHDETRRTLSFQSYENWILRQWSKRRMPSGQDAFKESWNSSVFLKKSRFFQLIVGYRMVTNCATFLAYISALIQCGIRTVFFISAGKKQLASQFNFRYKYVENVLSINNPDIENYHGQMYPIKLAMNDTTETNTSGSCFVWSYQSGGTVNFAFPVIFSTWVAVSHVLSAYDVNIWHTRACSSYECFILRAMQLSSMSKNVWHRLLGSSIVDTRILSNNLKSTSPECYMTFWSVTIIRDSLCWSYITSICGLVTELDRCLVAAFDFWHKCMSFSKNTCDGCGLPTMDAFFSMHLILSHFGLAFF